MAFASYYADHMVLQRAPVQAVVWGYAFVVGDEVVVTVDSAEGTIERITTAANQGFIIVLMTNSIVLQY